MNEPDPPSESNDVLQARIAELERENEELRRFVRRATHDLEAPLRRVVTFSDLLARELGEVDGHAAEALDFLRQTAVRGRDRVRALRSYTRLMTLPVEVRSFSIEAVVTDALGRAEAALQDVHVVRDEGGVTDVVAEPELLAQALAALLANAGRYRAPARAAEVEVGVRSTDAGFSVHVSDNGVGIEPRFHEQALEPLLRLASDLEEPGAGMGLALARRVVERWGGTLELHSVPGEGTTVTLEWPRP